VSKPKSIEISNKRASFQFHAEQKYVAGMLLTGTEVKSIRQGNINLGDAYGYVENGELFLRNMHISEYKQGSFGTHEPLRDRKLLLTKKELKKVIQLVKNKGIAIFPIRLFENERGIFKLEIGIGPGKKLHDKRDDLKEKDVKRELQRVRV